MTVLYADSSALVRAYLPDEDDHAELRGLLLEAGERVVTSEVSRIEHASAIRAAVRAGRLSDQSLYLDRFDSDCGVDGRIALLPLHPQAILQRAYELVTSQRLRTLDSIHLAVALDHREAVPQDADLVLVTRDGDQAAAARALGLTVS